MGFRNSGDRTKDERKRLSDYYWDSDEDDFGGFPPVETNIEELYPSVCRGCEENQCAVYGYITLLTLLSAGAIGLGVFVFVWETTQGGVERMFVELIMAILAVCISVFGGFAIIVSVLGCIGTIKSSSKLLRVTVLFFKLLVLLEIGFSLLGFYYQSKVETETKDLADWTAFIRHYHEDPNLRYTVDLIQRRLQCCGFESFQDWEHNPLFSCSSTSNSQLCSLPKSCCKETKGKDDCIYNLTIRDVSERDSSVYTKGCLANIQDWCKYNLLLISISFLLLAAVKVIIILCLWRFLRDLRVENMEDCSESAEQEIWTLLHKQQQLFNIARNTRVTVQRPRRNFFDAICKFWPNNQLKKEDII